MGTTESTLSIHIEPKASLDKIRHECNHNFRRGRIPGYVDRTRSPENSILIRDREKITAGALIKKHAELLTDTKMTAKAAAVIAGVVTFSRAAQKIVLEMPRASQDAMLKEIVTRLAEHMDVPVSFAVVHRDESAIHAHFSFLNVTSAGRSYRAGIPEMSKLQDVAGQVCKDLGIPILRGKKKRDRISNKEDPSKWIHRTVKQMHEDLPAELAAKEAELEAVSVGLAVTRELSGKSVARMQLQEIVARDAATSALREWQNMIDRCDSLRPEVDTLGAQLRGRKETLSIVEPIVQARVLKAEGLYQEIIDLEKERDSLQATIAKTEQRTQQIIATQEAKIARNDKTITGQTRIVALNDDVIAKQTLALHNLTATIAEAEQRVLKCSRLQANTEAKIAQLQKEESIESVRLEKLKKNASIYQQRVVDSQKIIAAHKKQLDDYPRFVALYKERIEEIKTLKARIAELEPPAPKHRPIMGPGR